MDLKIIDNYRKNEIISTILRKKEKTIKRALIIKIDLRMQSLIQKRSFARNMLLILRMMVSTN